MNRFFRTAYATTFVYLCLSLFGVLITRAKMPFPAFSSLYFALLLCLLPGISQRLRGKEPLFYLIGALTALLGFVPLALCHCPTVHWLIHAAGIAAAALFVSILRHRTTHAIFMAKYEFTVVLVLVLIGLVCLAMLTGVYRDNESTARAEALNLAMSGLVPYATVMLASGVLLLRGLRAQPGIDERAFNRRQLRDTLIFAVLVTLVFTVDPFLYLRKAIFFLVNDVLRPSARWLVQLLAAVLKSKTVHEHQPEATLPPEELTDVKPMPTAAPVETEPVEYFVDSHDLSLAIAYVLIAIAMLGLLYLLALQIRKLVRNLRSRALGFGNGYPNETREALPPKEGAGRAGRPKRRSGDPRERIRCLYADYLHYLSRLRVRFGEANTCGEIRDHAQERLIAEPEKLSALTALYEKARYRLKEAPSETEASAMKELLEGIKRKQ